GGTCDEIRQQLNSDCDVVERTETKIVESTIERSDDETANCGSCAHSECIVCSEHRTYGGQYGRVLERSGVDIHVECEEETVIEESRNKHENVGVNQD
ncbi:hypothetical protein PENTCL1PPCAC_11887, partial [Pristionchus entomophagus]